MIDPIDELKARARLLHARVKRGEDLALGRVGVRHEPVLRRHCLNTVAREHGFRDWSHARRVIIGDPGERDFGTLLYSRRCGGHTNIWFVDHREATRCRMQTGGYLLAYRTQQLVVDRHFVDSLGLDPEDPDWLRLGYDWVAPVDRSARRRLYGRLLATEPRES